MTTDGGEQGESDVATGQSLIPPRLEKRPAAGRLVRLCLKELREILRDRRTIITLVLMPLLVYPLLSILFNKLLTMPRGAGGKYACIVGVESEELGQILQEYVALGEQSLQRRRANMALLAREQRGWQAEEPDPSSDEPLVRWVVAPGLETQVAAGGVDVGVFFLQPPSLGPQPEAVRPLRLQLVYRETSALSKAGLAYLQDRLHAVSEDLLREQLRSLDIRVRIPVLAVTVPIRDSRPSVSLTTLIPLILILMTITGAVYPAIDLTAGERERGTLEALMAAPVPRLGLLMAKYVAVVTVALLTALANLGAMTVTLVSTGLGQVVFGDAGLSAALILQVLGLLILFAMFFSAILLAITSFARSFKEAQAYLIPVMLIALAPGTMSLMPEFKFNTVLSVLPLINIVLLARDLMEGHADQALAIIAILSTAIYALAAIAVAARIFGTDAILYSSQATWSDLLPRRGERQSAPGLSGALLTLAVIFPLYFLLANSLHRVPWLPAGWRLVLAGAATALLFAVLPLGAALLQQVVLRDAFRLYPTKPAALLAAAILGLTLWPLAHEIFLLNRFLGVDSLTPERIEMAQRLLDEWRRLSPAMILLLLAVTPAACEELFFRGYLYSALRPRFSAAGTILLTALLFGLFHVVVTSALSMERLLPSTFLGLVLGCVAWRTGSVWPGIVLHACHNGLLLLIAIYRDQLLQRGWGIAEQSHMPLGWLAGSAAGLVVGGVLLAWCCRPSSFDAARDV